MNNKVERLLNVVDTDILMDMVNDVNSYDNSLEYLNYLDMDFLDDYLVGLTPTEILNKMFYGIFNPNHPYFRFNGYENLKSYTEWEVEEDLNLYKEDIAERFIYLYENNHIDCYHQEICDILDEEDEEEDR